jgi:hypothetical protein
MLHVSALFQSIGRVITGAFSKIVFPVLGGGMLVRLGKTGTLRNTPQPK